MGCIQSSSSRSKSSTETASAGSGPVCDIGRDVICDQQYPMYVMKVRDVLMLTELKPHQELLAEGKIVEFDPSSMAAIFVSHQWVGLAFPDRRLRQFKVLQSSIKKLLSGETKLRVCATTAFAFGRFCPRTTAEEVEGLIDCYIWYDFFGVPQLLARGGEGEARGPRPGTQAAVDSIPACIAACQWFWVLAPWCEHEDLPGICSKGTWNSRGWCRAEQAIYAFVSKDSISEQRGFTIMHDGFVVEAVPLQWLFALPQEGDFAVETDRDVVSRLMAMAVSYRKNYLREHELWFDFRFLEAISAHMLIGRVDHTPTMTEGKDHVGTTCDFWLQRFGFTNAEDASGPEGWPPMAFAALEGNSQAVRALVAMRASVNATAKGGAPQVLGEEGMTPLMIAASYIPNANCNRRICQTLIKCKADIKARNSKGQTALHCSASYPGGLLTAGMLLETGADVNAVDGSGETPLHCSTCAVCTTSVSRIDTAKLLLKHGAAMNTIGGGLQTSPWTWVACTGNAEDVKLFLNSRADPDAALPDSEARNLLWKEVFAPAAREHVPAQICPHLAGATPIMLAGWFGNWETVLTLLGARADISKKSSAGWTVADFCRDTGATEVIDVLRRTLPQDQSKKLGLHTKTILSI